MHVIDFDHPHRKKHFAFFREMESPHFSITAPVPVQELHKFIKERNLHFTGTIVYLLSRAANEIREFRWRIRGQQVVEHDAVHPSFTVITKETDVFSFCSVGFTADYSAFIESIRREQEKMRTTPSLEDEPDRDDYLFMSSIPWVHFSGFQHPMSTPARDSVPRFAWGKLKEVGNEMLMPLNVQAHHAVVDGRHMGMFFEKFADYCRQPQNGILLCGDQT